jgi:hypothetical protein
MRREGSRVKKNYGAIRSKNHPKLKTTPKVKRPEVEIPKCPVPPVPEAKVMEVPKQENQGGFILGQTLL